MSETREFCSVRLIPEIRIDRVNDGHSGRGACSLLNALKNWGGFARH